MVRHQEFSERGGGQTVRLTPDIERTLRRYVLGDLEEGLRPELEELLITDSDAFEALGVIEDELIEEYLGETGSPAERRVFEQHFLSTPEGMRRLRLARALKSRAFAPIRSRETETRAARIAPARPSAWQPAWVGLAAALVVSIVGNAWQASHYQAELARVVRPSPQALPASTPAPLGEVTLESREPPERLARAQSERAQAEARPNAPERHLQGARAPVATFTLATGLLRAGGSLSRVTVPKDAVVVRLRLELAGDDYPLYRAALLDANGDEIWAASKLRAEGKPGQPAVVFLLPSGFLVRGDYQLKLSGLSDGGEPEAVGTYAFRVSVP